MMLNKVLIPLHSNHQPHCLARTYPNIFDLPLIMAAETTLPKELNPQMIIALKLQ